MPAPCRSSSPEGCPQITDEKKRKRMISNRESARRSRMRKQQHLDELINQEAKLRNDNKQIEAQLNILTHQYLNLDKDNIVLRAQVTELNERLKSMNSLLQIVEDVVGVPMETIPEIPDPLLKPWQPLFPAQPIMANAEFLQF